jgi:CelD/BcsL family acetyltransferase involved in cellulose biosynthesis
VRDGAATTLQAVWLDDPAAIRGEWDELADRLHARPWLRPGWFEAWFDAFGTGTMQVAAIRTSGRLTAVAPVVYEAGALRSPTNWHTPEFGVVAEDDASRAAIADALFRRRPRRISVDFLDPAGSGLDECRLSAATAGYRVLVRTLQRSPYVAIGDSFDEYLEGLAKQHVKELRRQRRLLEEVGTVTFSVEGAGERLDELFREGLDVEASGWKGREGTAIRSNPTTLRFYTRIAEWAAERDWLRLAFLRLDGEAIAFELMLHVDDVLYDVKQGYDERYRRYAPGQLLNEHVIEHAFASGASSYELLGDVDVAKRKWASGVRERLRFQAFAPTPLGHADRALFLYGRPVAKRVLALLKR